MKKTVAATLFAAIVASFALTSALAGPQPQPFIGFAAAHGHPSSGRWFTGITVTRLSKPLSSVDCHATLGGKQLAARQQRFYTPQTSGPTAITCAWKVPKATVGSRLIAYAVGHTVSGADEGSGTVLGNTAWLVRR